MIRHIERIEIEKRPQRSHVWPWLAVGALLAGLAAVVWLALF